MDCMSISIDRLVSGSNSAEWTVILAHGAGIGMRAPFMETMAEGIAGAGLRVVRFNFPYMSESRRSGKKRPPDPMPALAESYQSVISECGPPDRLIIGGKSMGGRVATMIADGAGVAGCLCLGYPFHPPGKQETLRTEHLPTLRTPTLILQGERDPLGTRSEVETYSLAPGTQVIFIPDGEHSFKPGATSGHTEEGNMAMAVQATVDFVHNLG